MKYKYLISLFLAGIIMQVIAATQKILHTQYADDLFKISAGVIVLALFLGIIKVISKRDKNNFLNK